MRRTHFFCLRNKINFIIIKSKSSKDKFSFFTQSIGRHASVFMKRSQCQEDIQEYGHLWGNISQPWINIKNIIRIINSSQTIDYGPQLPLFHIRLLWHEGIPPSTKEVSIVFLVILTVLTHVWDTTSTATLVRYTCNQKKDATCCILLDRWMDDQ